MKNKKEKVEIVELDSEEKDGKTIKRERIKNNMVVIIVMAIILAFLYYLPQINNMISPKKVPEMPLLGNKFKYENLTDGYIILSSNKGSITYDGLRFYNFDKTVDNKIKYNYKSNKIFDNIKDLEVFIEICNSRGDVLYRRLFMPSKKISKDIVYVGEFVLNSNLFNEANKVKIIENGKDIDVIDKTIICNKDTLDKGVTLNREVKYYFGEDMLLAYDVQKSVKFDDNVTIELKKEYQDILLEERTMVSNTNSKNIDKSDINILKYSIDLKTIDLKESNYKLLYNYATSMKEIEIIESADGWTCTNG